MREVIEGWVPEEQGVKQILRAEARYAHEGVCQDWHRCVSCHGSAKKVRITITVEEIDKEGGA